MNRSKNKIEILWISSCAPNKNVNHAGGHTFNYYFQNFIQDDRFSVRLISFAKSKDRKAIEDALLEIPHKIIYNDEASAFRKISNLESQFNIFNKHANLISNYCARSIIKELRILKKQLYEPDVIILEWTNIVVLAEEIKKIFPQSLLVASEHDVTFVGYRRKKDFFKGLHKYIWNIKFKHEKKIELASLKYCDLILLHNSENIQLLREEGISLEKMQALVPYYNNLEKIKRTKNTKDILFFGAMNRSENYLSAIWFIKNVLPEIKDQEVRFVCLGGSPDAKLKSYENEKIIITGFVSSIEPYFENALCFVAPLVLGAGIKVKVLEAMSAGCLVLTNDIGIEGIPAQSMKEYIHCNTPEDYSKVIIDLLKDANKYDVIEKNAKHFITSSFNCDISAQKYKEKLVELLDIIYKKNCL